MGLKTKPPAIVGIAFPFFVVKNYDGIRVFSDEEELRGFLDNNYDSPDDMREYLNEAELDIVRIDEAGSLGDDFTVEVPETTYKLIKLG